ncbi:hypothetical protein Tco_1078871 [Tanacetum coccineum]|uniref:Reverse transcriptase/retrotransposon-derived protein RNase H-like domain-containing protein n=1 Tax=Tanacetum coccineum TaxID=301880 RepID=A0ABQ5HRC6_9ASTR
MSFMTGTLLDPFQFPYPKRRLTMEEIVNKFIEEGKREHEKMDAFIREFRTTNELLLKERNNSLSELEFEIYGLSRAINKAQMEKEEAQQRKFLENLKQLHINIPFTEALAQMPKYAKFLKGLLSNKARLEEACTVTMNERCSAVLLNKLPSKEKDPGSFTIPCDIGHLHIDNALADLGASISLMPYKQKLKDLPSHLEYAYLKGDETCPMIIFPKLTKKRTSLLRVLEKQKGAIAWKMSDIKGISLSFCTHKILMEESFKPVIQPQRRLNPKVQDVVKDEIVRLLDAGLIYPISDSPWDSSKSQSHQKIKRSVRHPSPVPIWDLFPKEDACSDYATLRQLFKDKMIDRCEETNLVLNWEKCHFMVTEGNILGHKISGKGIEVDKAKIDVIAKLSYLTNLKGFRSFLGNARLENPNIGELDEEEIKDKFPDEHLMILKAKLNNEEPWSSLLFGSWVVLAVRVQGFPKAILTLRLLLYTISPLKVFGLSDFARGEGYRGNGDVGSGEG